MREFIAFFTRFLPDMLRGAGITILLTVQGLIELFRGTPLLVHHPVSLLKSTAVVFLIAVPKWMAKAKAIAVQTYEPIGSYLTVAIVYMSSVSAFCFKVLAKNND